MIFIIIFLCFLIRALPRFICKNALFQDTFFHLYCAEIIRNNSFRIPHHLPRVVLSHEYTYPFLYPLFLAIFPGKYRLWAERLTGPFFDTVSTVLVYLFSSWILLGNNGSYMPELVSALYAFSPVLLRIGSGPRSYNGSPRVIGQTLYLIHIFSFYYALVNNNISASIICLISGSLIILTSKFGNQVLIFFGIFFSIFISYKYLVVIFFCFILALVIGRNHTLRIISGQLKHSLFYVKYLQKIFLYPNIHTTRDYFYNLISAMWGLIRHKKIINFINWFFNETYPLHLLITIYPQFLLIVLFFKDYHNMIDLFILTWMGSGLVCFILTRFIKQLMFLGEGERYLEYALYPSLIFTIKTLTGPYIYIIYLFLIFSMISAGYYQWLYFDRFKSLDRNYLPNTALFSKLDKFPSGVIMPIGSIHWMTLFQSSFPVLTHGGNINENLLSHDEFILLFGNYPYPSNNFKQILQRYKVEYIVSDDASITYYKKQILKDPELFDSTLQLLDESSSLKIFNVKNKI
jgi:hypothetical protein